MQENNIIKEYFLKTCIVLFIVLSQISFVNCQSTIPENIFIRSNQIGFLPQDVKTAVILSKSDLSNEFFFIVDLNSNKIVLKEKVSGEKFVYGNFDNCYQLDFSQIKSLGRYKIKISNSESYPFEIGESLYNLVRDSLSLFFKVQRCGPTNPILHKPCHLSDVEKIIGFNDSTARDLTGGWHDAGDYIKFLKTTAFTTYLLMFSYEFDKEKFGYDLNKNNVPDILEEAKVGLDWLLRCNIGNQNLVSQVQDLIDHDVGWRLPENDSLQFNRTGFVSLGKNTIGLYAATLALASKIWKEKFYEDNFSKKCLTTAENFYSLRNDVKDIDTTFSNHYPEHDYNGKLALAAIELYNSTNQKKYLEDALEYGKNAGADFWWGVGDMNSLAHYKISKYNSDYSKYIYQNLKSSIISSGKLLFKEGLAYSWGTTNAFLGISLQAILYKKLTGSKEFDSLSVYQRDYILGKNPWGVSFIYNTGKKFSNNLHSQVAFFNNGYLPGGLSAGPAPAEILEKYKIERNNCNLDEFNSNIIKYFDDRMDYITNEPTIAGNATALFVFGVFSK